MTQYSRMNSLPIWTRTSTAACNTQVFTCVASSPYGETGSAQHRGDHTNWSQHDNIPQHAVLGHWNAIHIIDDETELQAWQWDGESVFELKRQTLLLDCFPERLQQYETAIPAELVVPQELRRLADASPIGFHLSVVAVDKQGYALLQTRWGGANGQFPGPEYTVISVRSAHAMLRRYLRQCLEVWPR
ncbi:hypothetical protein [Duganella sp. Root1480D1]|uniref:hypothetical protein n=1 Tax=Duganella sp. Root1480D1 TaxID=1736471 RepID=UPI00070890BE|nr:hypothetical protein [Duganella sp. Root1480D1]KQZ32391.1 hypothetical protein ASD58_07030 [Duganella sp. Root1480D1]